MRDIWLKYEYPCIIYSDRYSGVYSGADWIALASDYLPPDMDGDDVTCMNFWQTPRDYHVGKGETPAEALKDLRNKFSASWRPEVV